jgi:CheY-like chemotaxis protein
MFDPFFTTKFTGRGLGLAAAVGIARGHHGAIKVETAPGQGTVMTVYFPLAASAHPAAPAPHRGAVLVVDDEDIVRSTASAALRRAGYEVLQAANGQEALDVFRSARPRVSIVLLDMTMPVMSGDETLRKLREIDPDLPVVVSSGYRETELQQRFRGQAVSGYAQKPYTAAKLVELIHAAVKPSPDQPPPRDPAPGSPARG